MGRTSEALRRAEASRDAWTTVSAVDRVCEEIILSAGLNDEAYRRYGLRASRQGTYLATFRSVVRKYPHRSRREILHDLRCEGQELDRTLVDLEALKAEHVGLSACGGGRLRGSSTVGSTSTSPFTFPVGSVQFGPQRSRLA